MSKNKNISYYYARRKFSLDVYKVLFEGAILSLSLQKVKILQTVLAKGFNKYSTYTKIV